MHTCVTHIYLLVRNTKLHTTVCTNSVRNSGQSHSDIVQPLWRFVQPKKVWVRHLAEHYLNAHLIHTHNDVTKLFMPK